MLGIYCRTSKDSETSINQQKKLGIKFCVSHNLDYQVYEDEGISGYKKSDDEVDPFNNRPSFTSLINDIRNKKITQVWVYEHSRLSRNQYASAIIFNIFEKFEIELFENNKKLDLKDPQFQFMRQVMDAVSQLERHLIVNRTTRGLHNAINKGNRGYAKFFGYKVIGKDNNGKTIWESVDSEINDLKYMYKRFLEGSSLRQIVFELYDKKESNSELLRYATKISRFIRHCEYTGFVLNMDGLNILHKYEKFEIENISVLVDKKYWVKSIPYPIKIISIENWIKCIEKIHSNKLARKANTRKAWRDLATGIVMCPICNSRYYAYQQSNTNRDGSKYNYNCYKHFAGINNAHCSQKPKTVTINKIDEIMKVYYFYYYLVFNESNTFVKETLEQMRHKKETLEFKIKTNETEINKTTKQLAKLGDLLLEVGDTNSLRIAAERISKAEKELSQKITNNADLKIELEQLNNKYSKTELENTWTNIKEKLQNFYKMDKENQRTDLMNIIEKCYLFGHYLLIDSGVLVFLFDTKLNYPFDLKLLKKLDRDLVYREYFIEYPQRNKKEVRTFNDKMISNFVLDKPTSSGIINRVFVNKYLKKNLKIKYDISRHKNLIAYMSLKGIYNK
jgi:DNA invertase Pin-like site-specific DNA recombinase